VTFFCANTRLFSRVHRDAVLFRENQICHYGSEITDL
jgi:hypothetical protein